MVLDLLFGSLFRDPRAFEFQAQSRQPPEILLAKVNHLRPKQQIHALRVLILNSLQQRLYNQVLATSNDMRVRKVVKVMSQCPPMGVLVTSHYKDAELRYCKSRLCPWCHARQVVNRYHRLQAKTRTHIQYLVQARAVISDAMLDSDVVEEWCDRNITKSSTLFRIEDVCEDSKNEFANIEFSSRLLRLAQQVQYANRELKLQLRDQARQFGIRDGMLTYQIGPGKERNGQVVFRHCIGLLGVRAFASNEEVQDFFDTEFPNTKSRARGINVMGRTEEVAWHAISTSNPNALRLMLAGSSQKFDLSRVEVFGNTLDPRDRFHPDGFPGVLSLQPTYLFTPENFIEALAACRGVQLFSCFGEWAKLKTKQCDQPPTQPAPLGKANKKRKTATLQRRLSLQQVARQNYREIRRKAKENPGRPAVLRALMEVLRTKDKIISQRDARWLSKHLLDPES